ncbi:MAG: ABC transporter permease [Bacteroidia bacterium]|nr:ABC transporter permease [Bacteroidia bacterium]
MILHYIKIAIRNLKKYKMQTTISVVSMAVGITVLAVVHSLLQVVNYNSSIEDNPEFHKIHFVSGGICDHPIFLQNLENRSFKSIERYYPVPSERTNVNIYFEKDTLEEQAEYSSASVVPIRQEILDFLCCKSAITGDAVKPLEDNTVIVSEAFAIKHFGTIDVVGKRLSFVNFDNEWNETNNTYWATFKAFEDFVIADVMHITLRSDLNGEIFKKTEQVYGPTYKIFLIPSEGCEYQQLCEDLMPFAETLTKNDGITIGYEPWRLQDPDYPDEGMTIKGICYSIAFIILLAAFLGYIRMQIQLFWMRQREIALRTVVGGERKSLLSLFFTEVIIVLLLTLAVSLFLCHVLREQLYSVLFSVLLRENTVWTMSDFMLNAIVITAIIAVVCVFFIIGTVYQIRRNQTGLALQMKPNTSHRMRMVALGFQMVMSTVFIALSLMFYESSLRNESSRVSEAMMRSYILSLSGDEEQDQEKVERIKKLDGVEKVLALSTKYETYPEDDIPYYLKHRWMQILYQENDEVVDYYDVKITPIPCSADKEHTIYVSEEMYDAMTKGGTEPAPVVMIGGELMYVAGTYSGAIIRYEENTVILNRKATNSFPQYTILPKEGIDEALLVKQLTEIRDEGLKYIPKNPVRKHGQVIEESDKLTNTVITIIYILTIVNIVSTCSSLYSAVSLDVRRRKKEVSLRKINGAVAKDIFKLFAKDYIILLIICFVMALPLSFLASQITRTSESTEFAMVLLTKYLQVIVVITIVTAITVGGKIWGIMHLKPVEGVRE